MILPKFPKNCIKLRKFWTIGGCALGVPPLDPPLVTVNTDDMNLGAPQPIKSILPWMIHSPSVCVQLDIR